MTLQPSGTDPQLRNSGRRHVATKEWPQRRFLQLSNISPPRGQDLPSYEAVVERGKCPLNTPDRGVLENHARLSAVPEAVEQGDVSGLVRTDLKTTIAERGNTAKLTETVKPVKIAEYQPFHFAAGTCDQIVKEHANVSHRVNKAGDRKIQPAGHALAFGTYTPSREPQATSSADHTGFSIDAHGRLRITSTEAALRKHHTALIVRSVSRNMVEADFMRLLAHTPDPESDQGGLLQGTVPQFIRQSVYKIADTFKPSLAATLTATGSLIGSFCSTALTMPRPSNTAFAGITPMRRSIFQSIRTRLLQ